MTDFEPAKRVENSIRSLQWRFFHIDDYLLNEADKEVKNKEQGLYVDWAITKNISVMEVVYCHEA